MSDSYLEGLPEPDRAALTAVNAPGLARLGEYLAARKAIAFVGAGASVPLYPLWSVLVDELVGEATSRMSDSEAATCRALAATSPEEVVELVRQRLRAEHYHAVLRRVFRVRHDPDTGRTWTPTQELIARCDFRGVVTTNYDPGIVDARMRVRPAASSTGYCSWSDETAMDGWRTEDVFQGDNELPVLFAHGQHNRPEEIVLATTEYRRAYDGKLPRVLGTLVDSSHLVWIGFGFADERIAAILREIAAGSGTRIDPGMAPRHVAIMAWDPEPPDGGQPSDPGVLRDLCALRYGADIVLYPARGSDHANLGVLLGDFVDERYPAVGGPPSVPARPGRASLPPATRADAPQAADRIGSAAVRWVHGGEVLEHFEGRIDELAKLDRWAADPEVRLIGVTAWGGAGKTALVTEWLARRQGVDARPPARGLFAWSFYEDPSEEAWAEALLAWAQDALGMAIAGERLADRVLALVAHTPMILVLDGLERVQEGPGGAVYGRLLGSVLRTVLTGLCRMTHDTLAVLTSRFVFADLERFDGTAARMLDVPALTVAEGAELLERSGGGWLDVDVRRRLVGAVEGHALAVGALAGALEGRPPTDDLTALAHELEQAARTDDRVGRVLGFYADRLDKRDRALVAIVSLFQRPVAAQTVLTLGADLLDGVLRDWTAADVRAVVQQRLSGLLSWHGDGAVSAHPLVRDTFRPLALTPESAKLASDLQLADLPKGVVATREQAQRLVEIIELLLDAGQWNAADDLYSARSANGYVWLELPAAGLGARCSLAFVSTPARERACREQLSDHRLGFYLNEVGLFAMCRGDLATAERFLGAAVDHGRDAGDNRNVSIRLTNWTECLAWMGHAGRSRDAASPALELAVMAGGDDAIFKSHAYLAWGLCLSGETRSADEHLIAADEIDYRRQSRHLTSIGASWWGQVLSLTGRTAIGRALAVAGLKVSTEEGWSEDVARSDRALARCDLIDGHVSDAEPRLRRAESTFRDGDMVLELAETLVVLAEQRRRAGDLDEAGRVCDESISIAAPRELVPTHASALAARARICADRGTDDDVLRARDDADHALRLATKVRQLPWQELDALDSHAHIDRIAGTDGGWAERADVLRTTLIPDDLDPDPLATVEARISAERKSRDDDQPARSRRRFPRSRGA